MEFALEMENSLKDTHRVLHAKLGRTARLVYGFKSHLCSPHHYRSVLSTQKHAVEGLELYVQAGSDDKAALAIADAVNEDIINHADCMDLIKNALDALGKGFSVNEIIKHLHYLIYIDEYLLLLLHIHSWYFYTLIKLLLPFLFYDF